MVWTTLPDWGTIPIPDKDDLNKYVTDNFNETAPAKVTTKGDIVAATGANAIERVGVGSDDQVLIADAAQSSGVKWGAIPAANHTHTLAQAAEQSNSNFAGTDDGTSINRFYLAKAIGSSYANALQSTRTPGAADRMTVVVGSASISNQDTTSGTLGIEIRIDSVQKAETTISSGSLQYNIKAIEVAHSEQGLAVSSHTHEIRTKNSAGAKDLVAHTINVVEVYNT